MARSRSVVAGVMRSTMELGKATFARIHPASSGSESSASPATAFSVTWPLPGMLSHDITVKGATSGRAAALEARRDQAERRLRRVRVLRVVDDVGMGRIEALRRRRNVIAALGHGQRDDADLRPRQRFEHRADLERLDEVDHRAGHAGGRRAGLLLDDRRQPVLRLESSRMSMSGSRTPAPTIAQSWSTPALNRSSR